MPGILRQFSQQTVFYAIFDMILVFVSNKYACCATEVYFTRLAIAFLIHSTRSSMLLPLA